MTCRSKYLFLFSKRSHPAQHGETFDGPPTLERSGSEHRRAVTSFPFREGFLSPVRGTERVVKPIVAWLGCGALLAGETERQKVNHR